MRLSRGPVVSGRLGLQIVEKFLILQAFLLHSARLELKQELLNVLFPLLVSLAMPWVQLLAQALILSIPQQSLLDLALCSCLLLTVHVLIEVEVKELLLDTLFQLATLLHGQASEANLLN